MNYYNFLQIEPHPQPDLALLKQNFIKLSKQFHPDRFGNSSIAEQENALQKTSELNTAYTILKDADKALEYYLLYKEIIKPNQEHKLPPAFLMEMMELNEGLETTNAEERANIVSAIQKQQNSLRHNLLENCLQLSDNHDYIKDAFYKLKYYTRLV